MQPSWKTTTAGIIAIVMSILTAFSGWLSTGVMPDFGTLIAAIIAGVGLILAKDHSAVPPVPAK